MVGLSLKFSFVNIGLKNFSFDLSELDVVLLVVDATLGNGCMI